MKTDEGPILLICLYETKRKTTALHIQEGNNAFVVELLPKELNPIRESLERLIALIEKKMFWEKLPNTGGPQ